MARPPSNPTLLPGEAGKLVTAREAVSLIHDGDTVAVGGFGGIGVADEIMLALEARFLENDEERVDHDKPANLTLVFVAAQGDMKDKGLNRLAHPGLVRRAIGGHWGMAPKLQQLAVGNHIEAWNLPQGVISQLFRDTAAGKPGQLSRVGLGTFVDPEFGGGKINEKTTEDLVRRMTIDGEDYLFYKAIPIDVAIIRGTTADPDGNISMEHEALTLEMLAIAMAAHNSGGLVIAQVERVAERRSLNPRDVKIPGVLVDCVVIGKPENHWQTLVTPYNPAFSAELQVPINAIKPLEMSERKIIARRAAMELRPNSVVNLGIGMPEGVARVANEEKFLDLVTLTAEPGVIGGMPAGGLDFGAATNAAAVLDQPNQFDFYDGGGLDTAILGLAQADSQGNLNVSRFGSKLAGAGGFINISQNSRKVVFVGTFTTGGLQVAVKDGKLEIEREGRTRKFIDRVEHQTFSGQYAASRGQPVLYVTERCVLELRPDGLELTEIAPGVDLQRDILDQMGFQPIIRDLKLMDSRIFQPEPMGLRKDVLKLPLEARFSYDADQNILFLNFEQLEVNDRKTVEAIYERMKAICEPLGHRVNVVVNYEGFELARDLEDVYAELLEDLAERYYATVTRFTTSAFLRAKLGEKLAERELSPHVFESEPEAMAYLRAQQAEPGA